MFPTLEWKIPSTVLILAQLLLRPAIYLTPSDVRNVASLRHVLAHGEPHAQHLDLLWSPTTQRMSSSPKTDCELAFDEGAIRYLVEEEFLACGRTLKNSRAAVPG